MFFSFEGIDGSGKSTQARLLTEALRERDYEVVEVREPGGTRLGEQVRSLLLDPSSDIAPRAELLLFSAARAQLVTETIRPALARGAVIVADRYYDSSTAYQGAGRGLGNDGWISTLHAFATAGLAPDRTYLIDVDLDIAEQRRQVRQADRMETGGDAFYQRVIQAYRGLAASDPGRVRRIDGCESIEQQQLLILEDAVEHMTG